MRWYAVMTKSRKEWLAKKNLEFQGYEVFYPHYTEWTKPTRSKPRLLVKPYLTRYVFVALSTPAHSVYTINNTIGVSAVVYCGPEALELPDGVVTELMNRTDDDGHLLPDGQKKPKFPGKIGDHVSFVETSPLFGFLAEIKRVDNTGKLMVQLSKMLGAEREVLIDSADVGGILRPDGSSRLYEPTAA